jgi:hypothetical protein
MSRATHSAKRRHQISAGGHHAAQRIEEHSALARRRQRRHERGRAALALHELERAFGRGFDERAHGARRARNPFRNDRPGAEAAELAPPDAPHVVGDRRTHAARSVSLFAASSGRIASKAHDSK